MLAAVTKKAEMLGNSRVLACDSLGFKFDPYDCHHLEKIDILKFKFAADVRYGYFVLAVWFEYFLCHNHITVG